jgi:NTP pyrophosphatase (non-canonical NTP hydrolase)
MQFNEYQEKSRRTAIYPNQGSNYIYPTLGLAGESGEVSEKIKKIIRDKEGIVNNEDRIAVRKELGDVLWYLSQLATELDIDLESVAQKNIEKLESRLERGTLNGSGDDR